MHSSSTASEQHHHENNRKTTTTTTKSVLEQKLKNVRIILGSKSKTRREIMQKMGIEYEAVSADIDEKAIRFDTAEMLVEQLAIAKANAILEKMMMGKEDGDDLVKMKDFEKRRTILVTCDQVVTYEGDIREKPETEAEAREFMKSYKEGKPCSTVGSIRVLDVVTGKSSSSVDVCTIHFKEISDDVVDYLIEEGEVMWCAGGLMVEHERVKPFLTKIDGTENGVMGLDDTVLERLLLDIL